MSLNRLHLELHVDDFVRVKDFYGMFGFSLVREDADEGYGGYLVLELEGNVLCFWPGDESVFDQTHFSKFSCDTPRGYGVEIVVMVDDIEELYERVNDKIEVFEPLKLRPWGVKDFRVTDPNGYYLRFTQEYSVENINQ